MNAETIKAFVKLDMALTEKDQKTCEHTARNQSRLDIYELISSLYYLSDGGYSRIRISMDKLTAHLASEARAEVQFNWEYAGPEIEALNQALTLEAMSEGEITP